MKRGHACSTLACLASVAFACFACTDCSAGSESLSNGVDRVSAHTRGPSLVTDSIVLAEPDSIGLGNFSYVTMGAGGTWFVTAQEYGQVLKFGPDGGLVSVIGRQGFGPGELMSAGPIGLVGPDSLLAVSDPGRRYLSLFDPRTGEYLRGIAVRFGQTGQTWSTRSDTVIFSIIPGPALIGRWDLATDSVHLLGSLPIHTSRGIQYYLLYGRPEVVPWDSGYLAHVPTVPGVLMLDRAGDPHGTIRVPAARRRGVPHDLIERHLALDARRRPGSPPRRLEFLGSLAIGLHVLPSGEIGVLQAELEQITPPPDVRYGNFRMFLSVISADLSTVCVDAEIPIETDATPLPFFADDRLYVLSRVVTDELDVRAVLYRYRIRTDECDWIPTGGVQPL